MKEPTEVSTETPSLADRLHAVQEKLKRACEAAGRDPAAARLIAVSKTFPEEVVRAAYAAGQRHFGENYVQELKSKGEAFSTEGREDITWHFIGQIQSNKIKHIAAHASYVHALEKLAHAQALGRRAERPIKVLVSVNIGGEESKGGLAPEETLERCAEIAEVENIEVCGLMCMPPPSENPERSAPYFERMAALAEEGRARGIPLTELSMGMSGDFHVSVRYGATWVRVGSAIFGRRRKRG